MLVQKLHFIEQADEETVEDDRVCLYFENELNSDRINTLCSLFDRNTVITSLLMYPDVDILWDWLDNVLWKNNIDECLEMISALPDNIFYYEPKMNRLKDLLFLRLCSTKGIFHVHYVLLFISVLKFSKFFKNFVFCPGHLWQSCYWLQKS